MSKIAPAEFDAIPRDALPFAQNMGTELVELNAEHTVVRLPYKRDFLRPGGTIVVELFSSGGPEMVAHVTASYSLPPRAE